MLHIALTIIAPAGDPRRDVVVRAGGHRLVSEFSDVLAEYLSLSDRQHGLIVERTGEHLVPQRRLDEVDLREGDVVRLLLPGVTAGTRGPRVPLRRLTES